MKKKQKQTYIITEEEKKNLLKEGTLVYFMQDDMFIFATKVAEAKLGDKILQLRKGVGNHPIQYFPISVNIGLMRDHIGADQIAEYYEGDYLKLDMKREDFLLRHMDGAPVMIKHNKTKGNMEKKDILVKTWFTYRGSGKNLSIFNV